MRDERKVGYLLEKIRGGLNLTEGFGPPPGYGLEQFALEMVGQRGRTVLLEALCTFYH